MVRGFLSECCKNSKNNRESIWKNRYLTFKWPILAELRKSDLEVTARHLNEVEAVQHVHLTNIPVWFGLLGDV